MERPEFHLQTEPGQIEDVTLAWELAHIEQNARQQVDRLYGEMPRQRFWGLFEKEAVTKERNELTAIIEDVVTLAGREMVATEREIRETRRHNFRLQSFFDHQGHGILNPRVFGNRGMSLDLTRNDRVLGESLHDRLIHFVNTDQPHDFETEVFNSARAHRYRERPQLTQTAVVEFVKTVFSQDEIQFQRDLQEHRQEEKTAENEKNIISTYATREYPDGRNLTVSYIDDGYDVRISVIGHTGEQATKETAA